MVQMHFTGSLENPVPTKLKFSVLKQVLPANAVCEGGQHAGVTRFSWLYSQTDYFCFLLHLAINVCFDKVYAILAEDKSLA